MAQNSAHKPPTVSVKGKDVRFRTIGIGIIVVLAVWFIAANTESVEIRLWIPTVTLPLWVVLTVTLLAGMLIGGFLALRRSRR
ncbi:lipopolysaccharide assembly protein LapA domain-containing protein [Kitasatospora sp. NPDC059571]|uniref:lipopolysaccharide assembly protein LapA domain-containing protein n=1 Tax=Kitasatospora sp. NPDC059571 TaxID=3346871 RepID=UPI0036782DE6